MSFFSAVQSTVTEGQQTNNNSSQSSKSSENLVQWRERVSSVQRIRQDPASIAAAEARSQSKLRIQKNAKKAKRLQTVQAITKCSNAGTMASMRSATRSSSSSNDNHSNQQQQQQQGSFSFGGRPTRLPVVSASMSTAFGAAAENQTMEQANERAQYASKAMSSLQLAANVDDEEEADMLLEEARVQLQSAGHAWASRGVEAANEVSDLLGGGMYGDDNDSDGNGNNNPTSELNDLLSDLKLEPTNDDDCSTRFQLYEEHTETVSTIRKALFSFWDNAKEDVPLGAAKESIQSSLDNIDNAENLEVYLNPHYWFVYSMAKKVTSNETKIGIVLKEIQTKLELLASAVDCPICLESIENDDEHTFGCAHKVHKECWQHWSQHCNNIHKTPFCPLCRNDEFLEDILS